MKNFILTCLIGSSIIACSPTTNKTSSAEYPSNASGYNLDSSSNIDLVKKMHKTFENMDSVNYRSCYSDSAKFHDNDNKQTLSENLANFNLYKTKGITVKIEKLDPIWEIVNKKASADGITNYVESYVRLTFARGDKKATIIMNIVNSVKDGKIIEEWDTYDTKQMMEILK
jgi:hypothetical protein